METTRFGHSIRHEGENIDARHLIGVVDVFVYLKKKNVL